MNKAAIKNFAISARKKLIAMAQDRAGIIGVTADHIAEASQTGGGFAVYPTHFGTQSTLTGEAIRQRESLVRQIREKGYDSVMEEVAYTWFNRLVAVRFMEVNDYLPTRVRVLSSETVGKLEPDLVTESPKVDLGFTAAEVEEIYALKDDPKKSGQLFKTLFIKQCNALGEILPALFEQTADYTELLLDIAWDREDGVVRELLNIDEADFLEAVEIVGWMYQYYNTEPKQDVFDGLKKNVKITKEKIPAATQLFTPDWIVRYMVENSLGRRFVACSLEGGAWREGERIAKEKAIADKMGWKYYLPEAEQTPEVCAQLLTLNPDFHIEDMKIIDPCMGSGHILVYAFDVLMQIYVSCGYTEQDAASLILEKNLYGLDIDKRAWQLSYFAVMMKGRQYDRRFFARGIAPQLYCPMGYPDGEEFGSLLMVDELAPRPEKPEELTMFNMDYEERLNTWNFCRLLAQKYDVVVTNPPYMGSGGMSGNLAEFVKKNYPDSKSDMSTAFMEKTIAMCKQNGYMAMINIPVWMFLSSYEKLREKILTQNTISNMVHFGRGVFGSDFGTTAFVIEKAHITRYIGTYRRLFEKQGAVDSVEQKELWFLAGIGSHTAQQENFSKIPGSPIAYWVSERITASFENKKLKEAIYPKQGTSTGDDETYVRYWSEIKYTDFSFSQNSLQEALGSHYKYFPLNKGGEFRKWYGNNEKVILMNSVAYSKLLNLGNHLPSKDLYFKEGITWSKITSSLCSFRIDKKGFVFSSVGLKGFPSENEKLYMLGFLNSSLCNYYLKIISPGLSTVSGDIEKMPVIVELNYKSQIDAVVDENISISKTDWDSFETSWDFKRHPLI